MCRFSDAGNDKPIDVLERPASEKRQGTKSRGSGAPCGWAGAMGIWPRRAVWERLTEVGGAVGWRGHVGAGAAVNRLEPDLTACAMALAS